MVRPLRIEYSGAWLVQRGFRKGHLSQYRTENDSRKKKKFQSRIRVIANSRQSWTMSRFDPQFPIQISGVSCLPPPLRFSTLTRMDIIILKTCMNTFISALRAGLFSQPMAGGRNRNSKWNGGWSPLKQLPMIPAEQPEDYAQSLPRRNGWPRLIQLILWRETYWLKKETWVLGSYNHFNARGSKTVQLGAHNRLIILFSDF